MIIAILVFIVGTIIGSFLNVCIHRIPKSQSVVSPRSRCPQCGAPIKWYDNIPIVSFCILRGRCRSCKLPISRRYLLVEAITGLILLALFLAFGLSPKFLAYSVLSAGLIVATFIDFAERTIPDHITVTGLVLGPLFSVGFPDIMGRAMRIQALVDSLLGILAGGIVMYFVGAVGKFLFEKEAMGEGDAFLMAMIGAFLGWKLTLLAFFIAPFFGLVHGIKVKLQGNEEYVPYGPYLSMAALAAIFFGDKILAFVFRGIL
ncbi:MAG: prepilin peptidase [Candidatus Omnitrophica bacterium]|nr:prepilin peptidase [Candidatus Omnitrophota bacterium]